MRALEVGVLSAITGCAVLAAALAVEARQIPAGLIRSDPVVCTGNDDVVLVNRLIETDGNGVELRGNCDVVIRNCWIVAGGYGVLVASNGDVSITDSTIEGSQGALQVVGNGEILYSGSTIRGGIAVKGYGEITDGGGNTVDKAGARTPRTRREAETTDGGGGRTEVVVGDTEVVVGAGGVRIRTDDDTIEVGDAWRVVTRSQEYDTEKVLVELGATREADTIQLHLAGDVLFDFDSSAIRPDAAVQLAKVAHVLRDRSAGEVTLVGHTDSIGSDQYNQTLSEARAVAVMRWLNKKERIPAALMVARGVGASKPVAYNAMPDGSDNPTGRAQNRRVEIGFGTREGAARVTEPAGVSVGYGGAVIKRKGAEVTIDADQTTKLSGPCARVCKQWPGVSEDAANCAAVMLELKGYPVYDTAVCVGVDTVAGCVACWLTLDVKDSDCSAVAGMCLGL